MQEGDASASAAARAGPRRRSGRVAPAPAPAASAPHPAAAAAPSAAPGRAVAPWAASGAAVTSHPLGRCCRACAGAVGSAVADGVNGVARRRDPDMGVGEKAWMGVGYLQVYGLLYAMSLVRACVRVRV
jgi:hypothetical protein